MPRWLPTIRLAHLRDAASYCLGLAGCIHEMFLLSAPRPEVLLAAVSMLGLPLVAKADDRRNNTSPPSLGPDTPNGNGTGGP